MTTETEEMRNDRAIAGLAAPAIDPAFSARVQRRARSAYRERSGLRLDEAAVPALLLVAGLFYGAISIEALARLFGG